MNRRATLLLALACVTLAALAWFHLRLQDTAEYAPTIESKPMPIASESDEKADRDGRGNPPPSFNADSSFAEAGELARTESRVDFKNEFTRVRLLQTDFKYPLVRVEETITRDPASGNETIINRIEMVADHLMVKLQPDVDERALIQLAQRHGATIRKKMFAPRMYLVELRKPDTKSVIRAIDLFQRATETIAIAEPDYIVHAIATPNDAQFTDLWGMNNTGQSGGTTDADIDAVEAWDIATGSSNILVGIIDTGFNYDHEDLAANAWSNPGETGIDGSGNDKSTNGIDDDGNGFVDDWHGWDFANDDNDPFDDGAHGSHCAGTIGGVGNNLVGVAGVNWTVSMVGFKFLSSSGTGTTSDAIDSVFYGTRIGVKLTSNSWGGGSYSDGLFDAIEDARLNDILFVAAAGNSGTDNDSIPHYPSSYTNDNIIAVAATDHDDALADFSCYGATSVDLAAPGVNIVSTTLGNSYESYNGTSMATPHVSGLAALIWSVNPDVSYDFVRDVIIGGLDPVDALSNVTVHGGRINAYNSLLLLGMIVRNSTPSDGEVLFAQPTNIVVEFTDPYDTNTVQAGDLVVNSNAADTVTLTASNILTFGFSSTPVTNEGLQTMFMAEDALTRKSDSDGVREWSALFRYDALPLAVTSTVPTNTSVVLLPVTNLVVQFSEPVGTDYVGLNDINLSQGRVTAATVITSNTVHYALTNVIYEGTLTIGVDAGDIADVYGNPCLAYDGSLTLDVDTAPFIGAINAEKPLGSMLYWGSIDAFITPTGDVDNLTLELDTNQTISVVAIPNGSLRPVLELKDPANSTIGSTTASATDTPAILQAIDTSSAGTYTFTVSGADGTAGAYTLEVYLNTALEEEGRVAGVTNDTLATAQNVNGHFIEQVRHAGSVVTLGSVAGGGVSVLYSEDFETGLNGFSISNDVGSGNGLWHLSTGRQGDAGHTPVNSIYYGQGESAAGGGNYNNGTANGGAIYSPAIALPDSQGLELTFSYFLETEDSTTWDIATVSIDTGSGFEEVLSSAGALPTGSGGVWITATLNLSEYAGQNVVLRFSFDTIDSVSNDSEGWYVDDITITQPVQVDDWYQFTCDSGESASVSLRQLSGGDVSIELYDGSATKLAEGVAGAANVDAYIDDYISSVNLPHFARVTGYDADYALIISRENAFELEPNDSIDTAMPLNARKVVRGIIRPSGSLFGIDWKDPTPTDILILNPETAEEDSTFPSPATPTTNPFGFNAAYDGLYVWYNDGALYGNNAIYKLSGATGAELDSFTPAIPLIFGLGWLDGEIYATDSSSLYVFDDETYELTRTFSPSWSGPVGLAGDAARGVIWAVNQDGTVYEVNPQTGVILSQGTIEAQGYIQGLAIVGDELMVSQTDGTAALNNIGVYDTATFATLRRMAAPVADIISGLGGDGEGGSAEDWISFNVNAGDALTLETFSPAGDPQEPYEFHNLLDPCLELYDPAGMLIASNDNAAVDGKNARITHTATQTGTYRARMLGEAETEGEYVLLVEGYTGGAERFEVTATDPTGQSVLAAAPAQLVVDFSDAVLVSSLDAADLQAGGASATGVTQIDGDTFIFDLPALSEGTQSLVIAAGALSDIQNTPIQAYSNEIVIDVTAPVVMSSSVSEGDAVAEGYLFYFAQFSEQILTNQLDEADVQLVGELSGTVNVDTMQYNESTHTLTLGFGNLVDDRYTLTIFSGNTAFEDIAGNDLDGDPSFPLPSGDGAEGDHFVVHFTADFATNAYPTPLETKAPYGSLIYDPVVEAYIASGDSDTYSIDLDENQLLTVVVESDSDLQPGVDVSGPLGILGSAFSSAAGEDVVLQTVSVTTSATHWITVTGVGGSTGTYGAQLILNAAAEEENHGGPTNDVLSSAQDIDSSFITLTNGLERGAVLGRSDGAVGDLIGPDGHGHRAMTVEHEYENISGSGTPILEEYDDGNVELTTANLNGFSFEFYGETYSNLFINSNGLITFESGNSDYSNTELQSEPSQPAIAVFWDDLVVNGGADSKVCWEVKGSGDDQRLIIQWNDIRFFGGSGLGQITFQAILFETGHLIQLNYPDIDSSALGAGGTSASVGIKDGGTQGTNRVMVSYNAGPNAFVDSGKSLLIGRSIGKANTSDFYSFSQNEGDHLAVLLTSLNGSARPELTLYDESGNDVATGTPAFQNVGCAIPLLTAHSNSTYYAEVHGAAGVEYSLTVIREGVFDLEPNNTGPHATDMRVTGNALGAITDTDQDFYSFHMDSGETVTLETTTPGDQPGELFNTLDPALQLFGPSGFPVDSDDNSATDGRNAALSYLATESGEYVVRIYAASNTGPYILTSALPDQPPVLRHIGSQTAEVGRVLSLDIAADEPDGDTVTLGITDNPPHSSFTASGGTGLFSFIPVETQSGAVYNVTFTAADKDGADTNVIQIQVVDSGLGPFNMLMNPGFEMPTGTTDYVSSYWNSWGLAHRESWAARSEEKGGYFEGWTAPSGGGVYQDVHTLATGTYTFAVWLRREPGFNPTALDIKLEWFDAGDAPVQPASVANMLTVPGDGEWHHVYVTGSCADSSLSYVRAVIASDWNSPNPGNSSLSFDDAELYSGPYYGKRSLSNEGFEETPAGTEPWRGTQWYATPESESKGYETWAARTGSGGAALYGWDQSTPTYSTIVGQNLTPGTGTCIFTVWVQRETNFLMTHTELRIQWYDTTYTNKVQSDTINEVTIPNDNTWYPVAITGTCTEADLFEVRLKLDLEWDRNTSNVAERAVMIDDASYEFIDHAWDSDGDGMPDWWELVHFNGVTNATAGIDSDSDGINNLGEYLSGTRPHDDTSVLKFMRDAVTGAGYVIRWQSVTDKFYQINKSVDLISGFSLLEANIPATPPENVYTDAAGGQISIYQIELDQ